MTRLKKMLTGTQRIENTFALHLLGRPAQLAERIACLGIPESEMSETVRLALSALLEKTDDLQLALTQTQTQLNEIESLVDVDCVAAIPNRRAFMRRLSWVVSMHQRHGHPSSIVFFDLNGFKAINDQYGHAAGDEAIRHVSELLNATKRETDFLARVGGDEFAIILYHAKAEDAQRRAESIAEEIRNTPFKFAGRLLHVGTAVGCHALAKGDTAETALAQADQKMYDNKRASKAVRQVAIA